MSGWFTVIKGPVWVIKRIQKITEKVRRSEISLMLVHCYHQVVDLHDDLWIITRSDLIKGEPTVITAADQTSSRSLGFSLVRRFKMGPSK